MDAQDFRSLQEAYMEVVENQQQLDEVSDRKVRAVRDAREKQWNKQFGKNRVQDPTDDMVDKVDKLIDQRNKRTGSKVKKTTMGQLRDKLRREQVSVYDIILSHLLDEGYAETQEAAEAIMVNMSEEWRESVVEARVDAGKTDDEKRKARSERGTVGYMHPLTRGDKKKKGRKDLSSTGIHGKYSQMQHINRQNQRGRDADEQRSRDRGGMSRGTWDRD